VDLAVRLLLSWLPGEDAEAYRAVRAALDRLFPGWISSPHTRAALPRFRAALAVDGTERRLRALELLGEAGDREALPTLIDLLLSPDEALSRAATTTLGRIDPRWWESPAFDKALPGLVSALTEDRDRARAVALLRSISHPRTVPLVLELLVLVDSARRPTVQEALTSLAPQWRSSRAARTSLRDLLPEVARKGESPPGWMAEVASAVDEPADFPLLLDALSLAYGRCAVDLWFAARSALTTLAPQLSRGLLQVLQRAAAPVLRELAAETLGGVGATENGDLGAALAQALNDEDAFVRCAAARALGRRGVQEARGPLLEALRRSRDKRFNELAASSLAALGATEARERLLEMLRDREWYPCQIAAARALLQLFGAEAVEAVARAAENGASYLDPYWHAASPPPPGAPKTGRQLRAEHAWRERQRALAALDPERLARDLLDALRAGADLNTVARLMRARVDLEEKGLELGAFLRLVAQKGSFHDAQGIAEQWHVGEFWRRR
jgi:HEAT repeat protein